VSQGDDPQVPVYSTYEYAMRLHCVRCKAQPGEECDAPRKNARLAVYDRKRAALGLPPREHAPQMRIHAARQDAGRRLHQKELIAAYKAMGSR
jgi:hypothetical protein